MELPPLERVSRAIAAARRRPPGLTARRLAGTILRLALAGALLPASAGAQATQATDQAPTSSFSAEASAITLDVVVLDAARRPVTGLEPEDFEIFEDGQRQAVVAFEAREPAAPEAATAASAPGATNVGAAAETGRVMALLVDDLGIAPATMEALKPALAAWLRDRARDRDEITIVTGRARPGGLCSTSP